MRGESNATIFGTTKGHPRSPGVTKGQKSKIFNIGQMTYHIEGNCTGNRLQYIFGTTRGHQRSLGVTEGQKSKKFKIGQMTYQIEGNCKGNVMLPFLVSQDQRASKSRLNWTEGPVHQDQTGPKGHYIRTKLAGRASTSGSKWPEGPVH